MAVDLDELDVKLSAARTRLILEKPFLGTLVLRLPMKPGDPKWCRTTGTDARAFYYNPDYIADLSLSQTQFMLAHEALHCALSHFARRQHRVKWKWDLACDFAVNPILVAEGLTPPPDAVVIPAYEGMTAEEIYPLIDDTQEDQKPLDEHLYDESDSDQDSDQKRGLGGGTLKEGDLQGDGKSQEPDDGKGGSPEPRNDGSQDGQGGKGTDGDGDGAQPPPLTPEERSNLEVQWQQRMAGAAQTAMQSGKLSGALARIIDHLLQPQLPWRMLLARYMSVTARNDYNWTRPSRREGDAIMPSLRSSEVDVVVVLDVSGSIGSAELNEFVAEVNAIKGQIRARVTLHACDASLVANGPWTFESWEPCVLPERFECTGGTSFKPPFEWLDREGKRPDLLVYFTDAKGAFPAQEPNFPVLWLIKGREKVPWGQRIQLN
ncbi:MAG: hypothetical protein H6981_09795 [Gammaproteobacteria bacterium]|nr:hypothetical protein [Gammaproteobacteria bacterium]MCP5137080.1 hypothetical protein [Gammaproteobacteria bacterium]